MKRYLVVCILCINCLCALAQVQVTSKLKYSTDSNMGLDTNKLAMDEQGNMLHYYQYKPLLMSGKYGLSTRGPNGPLLNEYRLIKNDRPMPAEVYNMALKQMAIKSTMLEVGNKLSVAPFKTIDPARFDNKVIVMMFISPDCEPCMVDMPDISNFLKQVFDPNKMVLVALARGDESPQRMQFLRSLLPGANIFINYNSISEAYWVGDLTTGYVVTDKDHIIRFTTRGQGGIVPTIFKNKLSEVLK